MLQINIKGDNMASDIVLKMNNICKSFPGVKALDDVNIELKSGEVHAVVGENGAGKSTLMKILTGVLKADEGTITYLGQDYSNFGIMQAKELGIGMIYQELNLIQKLTVAENVFMGNEPKKGLFLDKQYMNDEAGKIIQSMGVHIEPKALVETLTVAYQQVVEIAKTISHNMKVLIMDEPTGPLTNDEVEMLFKLVNNLKSKGVSILYISHRLEEIFEICDTVTVLRDGQHIETLPTSEVDKNGLIKLMVGRELSNLCPRVEATTGKIVLEGKNLCNHKLKDVSIQVRKGEILGLGGLVGAGRTETVRALFGADKLDSGQIIDGNGNKLHFKEPIDAIRKGIVLIPEDRKLQGLLLHMSVKDNMIFPNMDLMTDKGFMSNKKIKTAVDDFVEKLSVKTPTNDQIINNLSGGNQQKVVIAKWLMRQADILIFDEPTRGIDVGAKYEIYLLLNELKKQGKAIIMVSSEMEELVGMSDRLIVMCEGKVTGELSRDEIEQEKILWLASLTEEEGA